MDVIDILLQARMWIDKGWCQHQFGRTETAPVMIPKLATHVCLLGGLIKADRPNVGWAPTPLATEALVLLTETIGQQPVEWNDAPERTKEEVLEAIDRTIVLALEREA